MNAILVRPDGFTATELTRAEAMRLLASVSYGRVVLSVGALPAIRAVNHLIDEGRIILRTRLTAPASGTRRANAHSGLVVAYEADHLDPDRHTGWSVVVTGMAKTVSDPGAIARYERLLRPWVNEADTVVAIEPQIVTGMRLAPDGD